MPVHPTSESKRAIPARFDSGAGGVWFAHYVDETNYTGEYFLRKQGIGRIDGIDADVDLDVFYPWKMK